VITTTNPATEEIVQQYENVTKEVIAEKSKKSKQVFHEWKKDLSKHIQSGLVSINNVVASDPRVPFGGIKKSGFGVELSRYGMLEFVNIKTIRYYDELMHQHHVE
jgi:acyl-CoA reductase-like NAD-dependent aldehyde dehydrogenase